MRGADGEIPPSEEVVWTGRSVRIPTFHPSDIPAAIVGAIFTGMALIGMTMVLTWSKGHIFGVLFSLATVPFLIIGLYLLVGRIALRRIAIRNSAYVLTYRRLRVTTKVLGLTLVRAAWLSDLPQPSLREDSDGVGTVLFAPPNVALEILGHRWMHFLDKRSIVLHGIADVADVRAKIVAMIPRW